MQINYKLGFTRLYAALWAIWVLFVLFGVFSFWHILGAVRAIEIVALWGLVVPAALLLTVRWVFSGFARSSSS